MRNEGRSAIPTRKRSGLAAVRVRPCLLAVFATFAFLVVGPQAQPVSRRPLVFLADAHYPPVSFLEDGVPKGIDADLARELSRVLGRDVRLEAVAFDQAQQRVLGGDADAVLDLGLVPERRALFDFTNTTLTHEFDFYVRRGDDSVRGLADLTGKRVGVTFSEFALQFLQSHSDARLEMLDGFQSSFERLADGSLDVVAADIWAAAPIARDFSDRISQVGAPFATVATAIAVRKGNTALVDELNVALQSIKADGTLARIQERWRPNEMRFVPQITVERWAFWGAAGVLLMLFGGMATWVALLKRQMGERQVMATALAASEEKFSKAFRASPDAITITDGVSGKVLEVNDRFERNTGFLRDEVIGRTLDEIGLVPRDNLEATRRLIRDEGSVRDVESTIRRKNGDAAIVVSSLEAIDLHGQRAVLAVHRDITAAREVEAQLRQAQKMEAVGRLAAGVAHDFNNLLTVILGNCDMALDVDGRLSPGSVREPLTGIRDAATRAAALTGQLLSFSRRSMTRTRVVDLNDVLRDVQRLLGRVLGEHIGTHMELADRPLHVEADTSELEQILLNLAVNARDAMPDGGRLAFSTRSLSAPAGAPSLHPAVPPGEYAMLAVSDTGAGMDARTRARIFEPFFTTKEVGQGTGLGLATVYAIVTRAGGGIDVASEVGQGTTFTIAWPLSPGPAPAREHAPATLAPAVGHETVWLVEDADDLRVLLRDALVRGGYGVQEASHADEALAISSRAEAGPHLLVTDVVLPGMNGRQLADILLRRYPDMRVLYLSGYTDDEVLRRGLSGVHFLAKPFPLATFTRTVRDVLDAQAT